MQTRDELLEGIEAVKGQAVAEAQTAAAGAGERASVASNEVDAIRGHAEGMLNDAAWRGYAQSVAHLGVALDKLDDARTSLSAACEQAHTAGQQVTTAQNLLDEARDHVAALGDG